MRADVAIIGAGPVGLFAIFALGQIGLSAIVVDALHEAGGQCAALYPEKPIYDIPSRTAITGAMLIDDLLLQAKPYSPTYMLGRKVTGCDVSDDGFDLSVSDGTKIKAGAVLIAAGAGAFGPNRPPIVGIEEFEGNSIFYSVRTPERFRGQRVVIAGGGDSAADWAVVLADIAQSVTLIHRRPNFRAAPATMARIDLLSAAGSIKIVAPATLSALTGRNGRLKAVEVDDGFGAKTPIPAEALLCFFGLAKDLSVLAQWDIGAARGGIPVESATMATKRSGIFAIGDIAQYPGKLGLILTGFAEAASAAHNIRSYLNPGATFHFSYSTSRGVPAAASV